VEHGLAFANLVLDNFYLAKASASFLTCTPSIFENTNSACHLYLKERGAMAV